VSAGNGSSPTRFRYRVRTFGRPSLMVREQLKQLGLEGHWQVSIQHDLDCASVGSELGLQVCSCAEVYVTGTKVPGNG
jgi:hypothetical protein